MAVRSTKPPKPAPSKARRNPVSNTVSHESQIRQALRRLARRTRTPPRKGLPHQTRRAPLPNRTPRASSRSKKSPRLGTVRDLAEAWRETFPASETEARAVARDLITLAGTLQPHELTELHIRTICDSWKARLSPATRYGRTQRLKRLIGSIVELTGRSELLYAIRKVRRPGPRKTIAEPPEIEQLLAHAQPWLRGVILLAAHAGLRRSDCLRIAPIHYNAENQTLTIDQKKTGNTVTNPVTERLAGWLEKAEPATIRTPYVEAYAGRPLNLSALKRAWRSLKKRAGVNRDLWIHDLRRTAAVSLYELTKDLRAVENFLGHASLNSTCGYLEHRDAAKLKPYLEQMWRPKSQVLQ